MTLIFLPPVPVSVLETPETRHAFEAENLDMTKRLDAEPKWKAGVRLSMSGEKIVRMVEAVEIRPSLLDPGTAEVHHIPLERLRQVALGEEPPPLPTQDRPRGQVLNLVTPPAAAPPPGRIHDVNVSERGTGDAAAAGPPPAHDIEIGGGELAGWGYRCRCGDRNIGIRYATQKAAQDAARRHMEAQES